MRERPIEDLLASLRECGVDAQSEDRKRMPAGGDRHEGADWPGTSIKGNTSSQFVSALLMVAPWNNRGSLGFGIKLDGPLISQPYVRMTEAMMLEWGATWSYDSEQRIYSFNQNSWVNYTGSDSTPSNPTLPPPPTSGPRQRSPVGG